MFASLLIMTSSILNLDEVGQTYQIVARIDCEVGAGSIDMNGADSTVSTGEGKKKVSLLFSTKWPSKKNGKIGVLAQETQGEETTLEELTYSSDYVPAVSSGPPIPVPSLVLSQGTTSYFLMARDGPKEPTWDYVETRVLVHGAVEKYQGVCELKDKVD